MDDDVWGKPFSAYFWITLRPVWPMSTSRKRLNITKILTRLPHCHQWKHSNEQRRKLEGKHISLTMIRRGQYGSCKAFISATSVKWNIICDCGVGVKQWQWILQYGFILSHPENCGSELHCEVDTLAAGYRRLPQATAGYRRLPQATADLFRQVLYSLSRAKYVVFFVACEVCRACNSTPAYRMISSLVNVLLNTTHYTGQQNIKIRRHKTHKPPHIYIVGPCHHGMARPQIADGGTASDMEGSCE